MRNYSKRFFCNVNEIEVNTYIYGLTTPLSSAQIAKLNIFVKSLKTGLGITALSQAFDTMYILGGETAESSLRNLVKRAHDCTAVNSPTFTQFEGFTGGSGKWINTYYNAKLDGVTYTKNNASVGLYSRTSGYSNEQVWIEAGSVSVGYYSYVLLSYKEENRCIYRINSGVQPYGSSTIGNGSGMYIICRENENPNGLYVFINKTLDMRVFYTQLTNDIPNANWFILARSNNNNADFFSQRQISFAFFGKAFTQYESNVITDAIEIYMDSNGKGVI